MPGLQMSDIKTAQTAPGFNLATAAQQATTPYTPPPTNSTPSTSAVNTPIVSSQPTVDKLNNIQTGTNQIITGVQNQAALNTYNQAITNSGANTTTGTQGNTQTATGQPTGGNQTSGGVSTQGSATPADNSDLKDSISNATAALNAASGITPPDRSAYDKTEATLNSQEADVQSKLNDINDQITAASTSFQNSVAAIQNGTFPLTPSQTALLQQTQSAVNALNQSAQQTAQLYSAVASTLGAKTGLEQFQPALATQNISAAMVKGQAEIATAEMNGVKQFANLQKGFADDDFNMISKSYDALQSSLDKKNTLLNKLNSDIQTQVKDYQANQQKTQDNSRQALNTILTQLGGQAFENLTPEQQSQMDALEKAAGWPVGMVKAGMDTLAEQKTQATQQLAQQRLQDQQAQQAIANEFRQAALNMSQQRLNITLNNQAGATPTDGTVVGVTGSSAVDATQPGYASVAVPGAGGLTQAAIDQAALQFATTGVMPSMGLGSTGAAGQKRTAIQNRAAELDAGGNIAANKVTLTANSAALKQQITYLNTTTRSLNNAEQGVKQLITDFQNKGINDQSLPIANIIKNAIKYQLGSGDVSAYKAGLQEVANEYTQVFSRGGQTSDAVRNQAQNIIDGNISIANLQKVSDELQAQGNIVIDGASKQIVDIQKQINNITTGQQSASSGTTIMTGPDGKQYNVPNDKVDAFKKAGGK
jgi:hypothetical protein